jgi:drug/metabolite transporter (DMT)-like permease
LSQIASTSPTLSPSVRGAALMLAAGIAFAGVNVAMPIATYTLGFPSTSAVFWQYLIAFVLCIPLVWNTGAKALKTSHPVAHVARIVLSAAGAQAFGLAFAYGVPLWQVIALVMTSPFFIIVGASLFLREEVKLPRVAATFAGFAGAMIILQPWSAAFTWAAVLPIAAAALWGAASLITKYLTRFEKPESITLYMMLLMTPANALFLFPVGLAIPSGEILWLILLIGALTAVAQYLLTRAYWIADATYLQPFDDLKLPLNVIASWVILAQTPDMWFWPGALLIVAASLFIMRQDSGRAVPA